MKLRSIILLLLCASSVLGVVLAPNHAAAQCEATPGRLIDSIPGDGDTNVATDASLVLFSVGSIAAVYVDEVSIERVDQWLWDMVALPASSDVMIRVEWVDDEPDAIFSFRTGTGQASTTPAPPGASAEKVGMSLNATDCRELALKTTCFDDGEPSWVEFALFEDAGARGWVIEGVLPRLAIPAQCGPNIRWYGVHTESTCFELSALGDAGQQSAPTTVCLDGVGDGDSESDEEAAEVGDGCGCRTGRTSASSGLFAFLAGALFLARRRRWRLCAKVER